MKDRFLELLEKIITDADAYEMLQDAGAYYDIDTDLVVLPNNRAQLANRLQKKLNVRIITADTARFASNATIGAL